MSDGNLRVAEISFGGEKVVFESPDPVEVAKWIFDNNKYPVLIDWMDSGFAITKAGESKQLRHSGLINLFVETFYPPAIQKRDELAIVMAKQSSLTAALSLAQLRAEIEEGTGQSKEMFDEIFPR
ncbi:hypothetical protein ABH908_000216 [Pseudomonas frederiksbergensis]|uniref:hypothetical protein n=1 Tax=Pseudomonas TaxID=286 RepID=UPI003D1B501B